LDKRADSDFKLEWYSGSGAGGQHRNKHQNSARIIHIPTGIVRTAQTRNRENSQRLAMAALIEELDRLKAEQAGQGTSATRQSQMGSGARGDKIRTYRFTDNVATDHRSGKKAALDQVFRGRFDLLG
jgi:peptide chain release factor 1